MVRIKFIPVFILILLTGNLQAQTTNIVMGDFYKNFKGSQWSRMFDDKGDIKGSPYENEEFVKGDIYTKNQDHYTAIPLRYNLNTDQMEFKRQEGDIFEVSNQENIDSVVIGTDKYIYSVFKSGSKIEQGYFRVLYDSNPLLLIKKTIIFRPAEPAGGYKEPVPPTFERKPDEFYLLSTAGEAVKFSGKKDFLEILNAPAGELEQFIKENKIRFSKQEDLISLMKYYSGISK